MLKYLAIAFITSLLITSCSRKPRACFETESLQNSITKTITFDNCSELSKEFLWEFGDGHTSTQKEPSHKYDESGEYEVVLNAFDKDGGIYDVESLNLLITSLSTDFIGSYSVEDTYTQTDLAGIHNNTLSYNSIITVKGEESFYISAINGYTNVIGQINEEGIITVSPQTVYTDVNLNVYHVISGEGTKEDGFLSINYNVEEFKGSTGYTVNHNYKNGVWKAFPNLVNEP